MRLPARGLHTGMTDCVCLHQANRRATIERMARMRVPQPVRCDLASQACPWSGGLDDANDLRQHPWPALRPAWDERGVGISLTDTPL